MLLQEITFFFKYGKKVQAFKVQVIHKRGQIYLKTHLGLTSHGLVVKFWV